MYADGTLDLMLMIALAAFKPPAEKEESLALVAQKAQTRYFPVFEKVGCRVAARIAAKGGRDVRVLSREAGPVGGSGGRPLRAQTLGRGGGGARGADVIERPPQAPAPPQGGRRTERPARALRLAAALGGSQDPGLASRG